MTPTRPLLLAAMFATTLPGCASSTEKAGTLGEKLTANGLEVTVDKVDDNFPVPDSDVTGLSSPTGGQKLVGVHARVCSNHGGAIGSFDFGLETTDAEAGKPKFPQQSYDDDFDVVRSRCGAGWIVFEIPESSKPGRVTFGFQDTGAQYHAENRVDARFSWSVSY